MFKFENFGTELQLPEPYPSIANGFIEQTRNILEIGESITAHVILLNSTTKKVSFVELNTESKAAKRASSAMVKKVAANMLADCSITITEAWGVSIGDTTPPDEIYKKYGSLSNYPGRVDIVTFSMEIPSGVWFGTSEILEKDTKKKTRTFKSLVIKNMPDMDGNFVGFLPTSHHTRQ
jgi:hypothetical protein